MKKPLHTVTLPILINAETPERATGEATCFPTPTRTRFVKVRAITGAEIKKRILEIFSSKKDSPTNEKFLYLGAGRLRQAYDVKDEWGLGDALKMVHPWIPRFEFGVEEINPDADRWQGARWDFSSMMSNTVQAARLIVWYPYESGRLLCPGVYCPNLQSAAFVMMVTGEIRVCPKCRAPFVPGRDNQDYCRPPCGVAYRTALSRWRAKQRKSRKKKARKPLR